MGADHEGWDWTPPDDARDERAVKRIGTWVDEDEDSVGTALAPHVTLARTPRGRKVLRDAQLTVADMNDDVEAARYELAMLGLIPNPYPSDHYVDPIYNRSKTRKKEDPRG